MAHGDSDIPPIPTPDQPATPPVEPVPAAPAAPHAAPAYSGEVPPPPPSVPTDGPSVYDTPGYSAPAYSTPAYAPGQYAAARPQGLSIASLICGIAGVVFAFGGLGLLPSIAAVITGHLARKRQPWARGLWLTGMITGYVGLGISIIAGVLIVIFFALIFAHSGSYDNYGGYNA